jgi:hypothetical protein
VLSCPARVSTGVCVIKMYFLKRGICIVVRYALGRPVGRPYNP